MITGDSFMDQFVVSIKVTAVYMPDTFEVLVQAEIYVDILVYVMSLHLLSRFMLVKKIKWVQI